MSGANHDAFETDATAEEIETVLRDEVEILFRQIHPSLCLNGKIASTAFMPSTNDKDQLSVDRSSLTSAPLAYELYRENGRESVAVYGVSVGQFGFQAVPCHSDPLPAIDKLKANPAHAYADFGGIKSTTKKKQTAQRLRDWAVEGGLLHKP